MTGIIITNNKRYIFRTDTLTEFIFAWDIDDISVRCTTHKWLKIPKGIVIIFDIDNPPRTMTYLPILE